MNATAKACTSTPKNDLVVMVHGTYAANDSDRGDAWWQLGSRPGRELSDRLPDGVEMPVDGEVFHWSGENSERARIKAAQDLLAHLLRFEASGRGYHLIGHSHGGSVIWHTLRLAKLQNRPLDGLRSWSTVGTPFLQLRTRGAWHVGNLIHLVMAILLFRPAYRVICKLTHLAGGAVFGTHQGITLPADGAPGSMTVARAPMLTILEWLDVSVTRTDSGIQVGTYDPTGGQSILEYLFFDTEGLVLLGVALLAAYAYFSLGILFLSPVLESLRMRKEARLENAVMNAFRSRWLGIWSSEDEAINGLRATLDMSVSFVSRMVPREPILFSDRLSRLSRPFQWLFAPIYNTLFRPLLDGVVRSHVIKAAQGNNRPAAEVVAVAPVPVSQPDLEDLPALPEVLNEKIVEGANCHASSFAPKLRKLLAQPSFVGGLTSFGQAISGRELVHTSYFDYGEILDLLTIHIAWARGDGATVRRAFDANPDLITWLHEFKSRLGEQLLPRPAVRADGPHLIKPRRRGSQSRTTGRVAG